MTKLLVLDKQQLQEQSEYLPLIKIYNKINSNQNLTSEEIRLMTKVLDCYHAGREEQDSGKWYKRINIVINIQNKYFRFGFDEGQIGWQDDDFRDTSISEVFPKERTIVKTVIDWETKK